MLQLRLDITKDSSGRTADKNATEGIQSLLRLWLWPKIFVMSAN